MPISDPHEIYERVSERASKQFAPKKIDIEEAARTLNETSKKQIPYDQEFHTAMTIAAEFDRNRSGKDGYVIKEGWDLHELIHSLVVLWRALKVEIGRGHVEVVPRSQIKNPPNPLDFDR